MRKVRSFAIFPVVVGVCGLALVWALWPMIDRHKVEANLSSVTASAGEDRTVLGPSPVVVRFEADTNASDDICKWYNQWGQERAAECATQFEVNFGHHDPQPGTQRRFRLVVEDSEGNKAEDWLTVTLGPDDTSVTGTVVVYQESQTAGSANQLIVLGELEDGQWYIASAGSGEHGIGNFAEVECYQGQHFEVWGLDGRWAKEGCFGVKEGPGWEDLDIWFGTEGWVVNLGGTNGGVAIALLKYLGEDVVFEPGVFGFLYQFLGEFPVSPDNPLVL